MKYMVLIFFIFLCGCKTTYEIRKETPEGEVVVIVESFREFQQPTVHYSREGDSVTFDFNAETATTGSSPIEEAVADGIRAGAVILNPIPNQQ